MGDVMSYRIDYSAKNEQSDSSHSFRKTFLTLLCLALFIAFVYFCWPDGRDTMLQMIIPGNSTTARKAAECFVSNIQCGYSIRASLITFFRDMMDGVKLA